MRKIKFKVIPFILSLALIFTCSSSSVYANGEVLDCSMTIVGVFANVLETFFPLIVKATDDLDTNNGVYKENFSYLPPDFKQDKFYISAYDGINPESSTLTWRVKAYLESNPNNPTEVTLTSGKQYSFRTDSQTSNMIFEFYYGDDTSPYERFYLPYTKQNLNYGIALGCNRKAYYLQKEHNRVFNDTAMRKTFNYALPSDYERIYNDLTPKKS